jgi:hypothetical protein
MNFVEKKSAKTFPGRQNADPHYLAALERGRILQERLKRWRGGGITVAEVERLLRISPASVRKHWGAGLLIGWTEGQKIMLARWQFRGKRVLPGIEEVLRILDSRDRWRVILYFFARRESLRKKRPLDLLRRGETQIVLDHAKSHAEDNTW